MAARVPGWETAEIREVRALAGGLTNQSFNLEVGSEPFVLRVSGENTRLLGIDREAEHAAMAAAARADLGPEIVAVLQPEGHLVRRYLTGAVWSNDDLRQPQAMSRVVAMMRQVHHLPPIQAEFSPIRDIDRRLESAVDRQIPLPNDAGAFVEHAAGIERRFWGRPASDRGLCHGDPFAGNFVATEQAVMRIDWEYAGMGDVYYDLACLAVVLPRERRGELLEGYFGFVPAEAPAKLAAMEFVMNLWNWTWALLQVQFSGGNPEHVAIEAALLRAMRAPLSSA